MDWPMLLYINLAELGLFEYSALESNFAGLSRNNHALWRYFFNFTTYRTTSTLYGILNFVPLGSSSFRVVDHGGIR
jgi:hypothetical protein